MKKIKTVAHVLGIINWVPFFVAMLIVFTGCKEEEDFVSVSSISGVPAFAEVNKPLTLTATVSPSTATNQTILWSIKDAGTTGASISSGNILTATAVGTVSVTATIANGATKNTPFTNDFSITVQTNLVVSGVTVTPSTSDMAKGTSLTFTAIVSGNNLSETDKVVNWSVTGNVSMETAISADGTLSIASAETAENLTITATSAADNTKSGTATARVYELQTFNEDFTEGAEVVEIEYNGDIIVCNYVDGRHIIQGDIVLDIADNEIETNSQGKISTRAAMNVQHVLWPQGKVYYFKQDDVTTAIVSDISYAINILHTETNLKMIELLTDEARVYKKSTRIKFVPDNGNSSYVGLVQRDDFQDLWLHRDNPSALHEIGHAVGLEHEQSRPDRDDFVIIHFDNVEENKEHNFDMFKTMRYFSETFDFGSVMMYHPYSFAKDSKKPTITKKDGSTYIVQRSGLSSFDRNVINEMYPQQTVTADYFIHDKNIEPTSNSCVLTGELIYEGYPAVSEYGVYYREEGATAFNYAEATTKDNVGRFSVQLSGLNPNTTYEAGVYVVQNSNGQKDHSPQNPVTFKTQETVQSEFYQGASGYVKFNMLSVVGVSNLGYIGSTTYYSDIIFEVRQGDGDLFYLEKIDDTRYFIKYEDQYVVPAIPAIVSGIDIHNYGKYTVVSTAPTDGNFDDYTYTFSHYLTIEGKSYYTIKQNIVSDLWELGMEGNTFYVNFNYVTGHLTLRGETGSSTSLTCFAIEEIDR